MSMSLDEMIAVLEGAKAGKKIQCKSECGKIWSDTEATWDFFHYDYRIKPEPREWFLIQGNVSSCCAQIGNKIDGEYGWHVYDKPTTDYKCIHVREVLE